MKSMFTCLLMLCMLTGYSTTLPTVAGVRNCTTGVASILVNDVHKNVCGTLTVYADRNNNNKLDGSDDKLWDKDITIDKDGSYVSPGIIVPVKYKYSILYIVFKIDDDRIYGSIAACPAVAPVTGLESFRAWKDGDYVRFSWTTQSEQNCSHFQVQKQLDSVTWVDVAVISTRAVDGNSATAISYTASYTTKKIVYSSMLWLGLFMIGSLFLRRFIPARLLIIVAILGVVACQKQNPLDEPDPSSLNFRLKQVDLDGQSHIAPLIRTVKL